MESGSGKQAEQVRSTYAWWGKSGLYNPATVITLLGRERVIRRQCVEQLGLHEGDRVIDIACGTGRSHPYLVEAVGDAGSVVGVDLSPEMLERARGQAHARGWDNVTLIEADAAEIDLPEKSFDGVICTLGFSVMPHYEKAIRRAVSLLKDDGRIVVCDATPFRGVCALFNVVVVPLYRRVACWDPRKDVLGTLEKYAAGLDVRWFNGGSLFIAAGRPLSLTGGQQP